METEKEKFDKIIDVLFPLDMSYFFEIRVTRLGFAPGGRTSLPPRAIIESKANRHSAGADAVFLYVADPYESKLSTAHLHTKKRNHLVALCFGDSVGKGKAKLD